MKPDPTNDLESKKSVAHRLWRKPGLLYIVGMPAVGVSFREAADNHAARYLHIYPRRPGATEVVPLKRNVVAAFAPVPHGEAIGTPRGNVIIFQVSKSGMNLPAVGVAVRR